MMISLSQFVLTTSQQFGAFPTHASDCTPNSDNVFGPFSDCRFDFTLYFEQAVLSVVPAIIILLAAPGRIFYLWKQNKKVVKNNDRILKLVRTMYRE